MEGTLDATLEGSSEGYGVDKKLGEVLGWEVLGAKLGLLLGRGVLKAVGAGEGGGVLIVGAGEVVGVKLCKRSIEGTGGDKNKETKEVQTSSTLPIDLPQVQY
jgi:hypothetical protein